MARQLPSCTNTPGGGEGGGLDRVLPYMGYIVCATVNGMVFKQFTLG